MGLQPCYSCTKQIRSQVEISIVAARLLASFHILLYLFYIFSVSHFYVLLTLLTGRNVLFVMSQNYLFSIEDSCLVQKTQVSC